MNIWSQNAVAVGMKADEMKRKADEQKRITLEGGVSRATYDRIVGLSNSLKSRAGKNFERNIERRLLESFPGVDIKRQYKPIARGKHSADLRLQTSRGEVCISAKVSLRERWKQWKPERTACATSVAGGRRFLFVGICAEPISKTVSDAMSRADTIITSAINTESVKAMLDRIQETL